MEKIKNFISNDGIFFRLKILCAIFSVGLIISTAMLIYISPPVYEARLEYFTGVCNSAIKGILKNCSGENKVNDFNYFNASDFFIKNNITNNKTHSILDNIYG